MRNEACMKKVRQVGYWVKVREYYTLDGIEGPYGLVDQFVRNVMSEKCRSDVDIWRTGSCKGCKQEQDFDYFRSQGLV